MAIRIEPILNTELKPKINPEDEINLGFGKTFTDRMLIMEYSEGNWNDPVIKKYEPITLDPSAVCLHYGQTIFEGMKGFLSEEGHINLFRPEQNAYRFNSSARRMVMPEIEPSLFLNGLKKLISLEKDWAPRSPGSSLYIRPTMIGSEPGLGVRAAKEFLFYILLSPSASLFPEGFNPIKIYVSEQYSRAAPGGTGNIKAGGNYGASLLAGNIAIKNGCKQVLWLDAVHRKYAEEVGAMNIIFVYEDILYTAPLTSGTILPGITRDSTIKLANDLGYTVKEEALSIDAIIEGIHNGKTSEILGVGTAAAITPVGSLYYKNEEHVVNNFETGEISAKLYEELLGIQYGRKKDPYGWIVKVE